MSRHPMQPSDLQLKAAVLCPKFTAIASVVGSSLIIRDIVLRRRNSSDGVSTRHRLLAGMSVCDILSSSAWFLTSWPVPKDVPMTIWTIWNVGNRQTCTAQGFFIQLSIGTVTYNACLALYYLFVIRYGWKDKYISKYVEPCMHFIAIGFALSTSVAALALDLFNPFGYTCFISAYPRFCTQSWENKGPTNCIHGDNARFYQEAFWILPACCLVVFVAVSMFLVYWKIRTIESGSSHFQSQPGRMQQRFALQAFLYVGAMFITWGPLLGMYISAWITRKPPNWWLGFWTVFLSPAQGFFNSLIYFHSPMKQPRRSTVEQSRSSSDFTSPLRLWGSFRRSFSKGRSSAIADPMAVAARAIQEKEPQYPQEENAAIKKIERNEATEGSRILSDPAGMELSKIPEANLER